MTIIPKERRRYQFSLRTLFCILTGVAVLLGLYVFFIAPAERQRAAARRIEAIGGRVMRDTPGWVYGKGTYTGFWGERQLREWLPVDYIDNVVYVDMSRTQATDADMRDLYLFPKLETVQLQGTQVTKEEIAKLRKARILALKD